MLTRNLGHAMKHVKNVILFLLNEITIFFPQKKKIVHWITVKHGISTRQDVDPKLANSENENTQKKLPVGHWLTGEINGV
jgi:hypothetical protein